MDMEAIMALPDKTGSQDVIEFVHLEIGPAGVIVGGAKKAIDTNSFNSLIPSFSVVRPREHASVHYSL